MRYSWKLYVVLISSTVTRELKYPQLLQLIKCYICNEKCQLHLRVAVCRLCILKTYFIHEMFLGLP